MRASESILVVSRISSSWLPAVLNSCRPSESSGGTQDGNEPENQMTFLRPGMALRYRANCCMASSVILTRWSMSPAAIWAWNSCTAAAASMGPPPFKLGVAGPGAEGVTPTSWTMLSGSINADCCAAILGFFNAAVRAARSVEKPAIIRRREESPKIASEVPGLILPRYWIIFRRTFTWSLKGVFSPSSSNTLTAPASG